jgi:hypothetical protein
MLSLEVVAAAGVRGSRVQQCDGEAAQPRVLQRQPGIVAVGAWSAASVAVGYVVIVALYSRVGAPPSTGAQWLSYGAGRGSVWSWILALSVATDLLYVPVAVALYRCLAPHGRQAAGAGVVLLAGFVVLDLAVTWPNYAALIGLSQQYAAAPDAATRTELTAAADLAESVLSSHYEVFLSVGLPAAGILVAGLIMRGSAFAAATRWAAVSTGVLGIAAVAGQMITPHLGVLVILASVSTTVWFAFTARDLHRLRCTMARRADGN